MESDYSQNSLVSYSEKDKFSQSRFNEKIAETPICMRCVYKRCVNSVMLCELGCSPNQYKYKCETLLKAGLRWDKRKEDHSSAKDVSQSNKIANKRGSIVIKNRIIAKEAREKYIEGIMTETYDKILRCTNSQYNKLLIDIRANHLESNTLLRVSGLLTNDGYSVRTVTVENVQYLQIHW